MALGEASLLPRDRAKGTPCLLTEWARGELDLEAERFWVIWNVLELWAPPGEGRLGGAV